MAGVADPDYVELELPREAMTLEYLTVAACEELGVEADQVTKSIPIPYNSIVIIMVCAFTSI